MRTLILLCIALVPNIAIGQLSQRDHEILLRSERAQMEAEANWNAGKKLSPLGALQINGPRPKDRGTLPNEIGEGRIADLTSINFKILEVIDENNCLLIWGDKVYWLENFPTKGLATDDSVFLVSKVRYTGTKDYLSASGKMTVRKFAFLSKEELEKERTAEAAEREAKEWPEWRSTAGTTIKAKFIGGAGGVQLQTKEGRKLTVPLSKFVDEDKEKLRELINEWRKKKK